ncbi:uncharacterized protein LOC117337750, partial [Pecten maximus]|uniref:uncharacterized protein LOC117337750 n=1 Tax=Pecten maximus TaxID=6579 RepID=UPI0014580202
LDWPKEANEWVSRPRPHGWPDKALRDKIVHDGCHLVPVGDKTSDDTFLQWRISFITAERKLMYSLTHVQFLVYGLLKYFLKQISSKLKQLVGDTDILSSYIMKTVLFHAIESTPDSFWQEKHTFLCFMLCLNILITWVKAGYCPNYFIKRNNMFLGKVYGENREKLLRFLIDLHDKKWGCLSVGTFIQPSIGERIDRVRNGDWEYVLPPPSETERERDLKLFMELSTINYDTDAITVPLELLSKSKSDVDEFVSYVIAAHGLSKTAMETYGEHTFVSGNKEKYKCLRKSKKLMTPLATVCSSPGELTLATYYYNTGNYTKALNICVLTLMSPFKIYFGGHITVEDADRYRHQICGHGHTLLHKAQQIFASDIKITEFSAQFCLPHLHHEFKKLRGDVLLIPPVPYALFLYFLCYHELGDTSTRDKALNLLRTVKYDEYQGGNSNWIVHNMLGVCYEVVGDARKALEEYRDSLKVERFDQYINPAKERIERLNSYLNRQ